MVFLMQLLPSFRATELLPHTLFSVVCSSGGLLQELLRPVWPCVVALISYEREHGAIHSKKRAAIAALPYVFYS